jgi:hypothetical protein
MAKSFYTTGTGDEQTLTPIINEKVPIYDTIADAESDLSNLEVGQIVKTKDAGLVANLNPIDEVKQGVFLPPTSNAVAKSLSYFTTEQKTGGKWIDGKDIYRKTFIGSGISSEVIILSTELNKTTITPIKVYGFGENSADGNLLCVGYGNGANVLVSNNRIQFGGDYTFSAYNITIEYTKTTD